MSVALEAPPEVVTGDAADYAAILRLSVDQYHAMIRAGVFADDDRIELLEGLLIHKMTKYPPHTFANRRLKDFFERSMPPGYLVATQDPVTSGESEPEPVAMLVRGSDEAYKTRHPGPAEVAVIAESSLDRDERLKQRIYARAGFAYYWLVDIKRRIVRVYTDPSGPIDDPATRPGSTTPRASTSRSSSTASRSAVSPSPISSDLTPPPPARRSSSPPTRPKSRGLPAPSRS